MNGFGFVVLPFTVKHNTLGEFLLIILRQVLMFFLWVFFEGGGEGGSVWISNNLYHILLF